MSIEKRTFFKETGNHDYWYPEIGFKELEAKNAELESYKKDWQEIAGKANLKHLASKNVELEKHNVMLEHQLKYAETILTDVQADKFKLREKLQVAEACLRELRPVIERGEDWELGRWIDEALAKIKGEV